MYHFPCLPVYLTHWSTTSCTFTPPSLLPLHLRFESDLPGEEGENRRSLTPSSLGPKTVVYQPQVRRSSSTNFLFPEIRVLELGPLTRTVPTVFWNKGKGPSFERKSRGVSTILLPTFEGDPRQSHLRLIRRVKTWAVRVRILTCPYGD